MEIQQQKFKMRLGAFVIGGLALFVLIIFIIGKQRNLFNPVFKLSTTFNSISGLQVGNNVRFSGINVGTVDNIFIVNDSTVLVQMLIRKEIQKFIKTDCVAGIGSEGVIGDKILVISQSDSKAEQVREGQFLRSQEPVETDAIMSSLQITSDNAAIISEQLALIMLNVNSGRGVLGQLVHDSVMAENFKVMMENLRKSSKGLDENMEAAKHNFLLKGYFNKKAKEEERKRKKAQEILREEEEKKKSNDK